jgi:mannosyltransferase
MARTWLLAAIVWLAFAVRAFRLDAPPYRGDEAFVIWFVQQDWLSLLAAIARSEPHPPLFYLIAKGWRDVAGDVETVFRFVPLFFSVLAVPAAAKVGEGLGGVSGGAVGLVAALLLAINPFHVWNAQDARMYTQAVAFALLSVLAFLRLDAQPRDGARLAHYLVFSALAVLTHYTFLPVLAVQNVFWLLRHLRDRTTLLRWLVAQAGLAALALGWIAWNSAVLIGYRGNGDQPTLLDAIQRAAVAYLTGRSGSPEWAPLAGLFGLAVALLGAGWLGRRLPGLGWFAIASVAVAFGVQWAASLRGPVFNENYLLSVSGLYFVLLGAGVVALGRWLLPVAGAVALGVLGVASVVSLGNYWLDPTYAKAADWRSPARVIARDARPGDVIIVNYPDPTFEYYYRGPAPVRLIPASVPVDRATVARELAALAAEARRVWLIPVRAANWDSEGLVEHWLETHTLPVGAAAWHHVRVVLYETPAGVLASATPSSAELDGFRLRGATIVTPEECRSPCEVSVRLVWSAARRPRQEYKVFVHAVDDRGALVAQSDGVPAGWRRPTTGWAPNELVVDAHALRLPAGRLQILVGLYREEDGRLLAPDGRDAILVGEVTVR